jgi:predicted amidophosphoribosyltransferase
MNMAQPLPCPQCGAQMPDGVFTETCPSCGQAVVFTHCPSCKAPGLLVIRQRRQRVANCESCGWVQIQQGLADPATEGKPETQQETQHGIRIFDPGGTKICARCGTENRPDANYCKHCGTRINS